MSRLSTKRLVLQPIGPEHIESLFSICSDAENMQYWNRPPWQQLSQAEESINGALDRGRKGEQYTWAVMADGRFIGQVLLFLINEQCRRAELGFVFDKMVWGKGFASEASREVLNFAFNTLNLNRVEAETDTLNKPCRNLLERLGFVHEGDRAQRYIVSGVVSDSAMYGLVAEDY